MQYKYITEVKNNDTVREAFNALTRKTFGFDFSGWYAAGHWGDLYLPHVLMEGGQVISNVSVNLIQFDMGGVKKNYIQLGTVMTDEEYRGQGLNREIMERVLQEYRGKADGIYLFGNDSVVNYYPKFGFQPSKEYEYYMPCKDLAHTEAYAMERVNMDEEEQCERLYERIRKDANSSDSLNQNDAMYMNENLSLYQFWLGAEYGESVYYLPETDNYVIAELMEDTLHVLQIFGKQKVELARLAKAFGEQVKEIVLGYTPVHKEDLLVREHKEEDSTLFILGDDLQCIEREKMMFPVLSHA